MESKTDLKNNKLLHERFHSTDMCVHCNERLADWEFKQECPVRLAKAQKTERWQARKKKQSSTAEDKK